MLQVLQELDPKEAEAVLASLTFNLLPNPDVETHSTYITVDPARREQVRFEILRHLRLDAKDNSLEARARLYQFLAEELNRIALSHTDQEKVRARLGQRGDLRSNLYEIQITDTFRLGVASRGIRRNHVLAALVSPDSVEHLLPERFGAESGQGLSLYVKAHQSKGKSMPFSLLILSRRSGFVQYILDAWRVYKADVTVYKPESPIDMLLALVEQYGLLIRIGTRRAKFFLYQETEISDPEEAEFSKSSIQGGEGTLTRTIQPWLNISRVNIDGLSETSENPDKSLSNNDTSTGNLFFEKAEGIATAFVIDNAKPQVKTKVLQVEIPNDEQIEGNFVINWTPQRIQVAIAFALDKRRYEADLRKRGVPISS